MIYVFNLIISENKVLALWCMLERRGAAEPFVQ